MTNGIFVMMPAL